MHRIITTALSELGLAEKVQAVGVKPIKHGNVLCFQQHTPGDLLSLDQKVVGSAQRKYRQALMQHGSILLARSEHAPDLPGLLETAGIEISRDQLATALRTAFAANTRWTTQSAPWSDHERRLVAQLVADKYATAAWNQKR